MRGTARPVPPATSALPGRLRLVSHARPGQHRACPPSLRWGHVCGAARLPNPCPALADGQSWAHLGPRPVLLGDQGTMVRVSVLEGTASLSLPHISLPRTSFKRWKIPAGGRHGRERGAGQRSSVGSASRYVGWEVHCIRQRGQQDVHHPGQAWLLRCARSPGQAPARHSPQEHTRCRWEPSTRGDRRPVLPALPVPHSTSLSVPTARSTHP